MSRGGGQRLLVVDDLESMRLALQDMLSLLGYQVVTAASAAEALAHLRERRFDMLLSDLAMPGMDGIQLAELASRRHPEIPIVLITGHGDADLARASLQRGAIDFITKPVNFHELPIVVERNLERRRLEVQRLKEKEVQVLLEAVKALAEAINAKEPYIGQHSRRVTRYALALADAIAMGPDDRYVLELGAWMHDVGKIGTPDYILSKPARLTSAEQEIMKEHSVKGGEIIGQIEELRQVADIIRHHHEQVDGRGYPDGLRGEAIPLCSRIVLIADAYDSMTSDRIYRKAVPREVAFGELAKNARTQFDPELVEAFLRRMEGGQA